MISRSRLLPEHPEAARDRAPNDALRSVLAWVAAQHRARLDIEGTDIAISTARALGATSQQIETALRASW